MDDYVEIESGNYCTVFVSAKVYKKLAKFKKSYRNEMRRLFDVIQRYAQDGPGVLQEGPGGHIRPERRHSTGLHDVKDVLVLALVGHKEIRLYGWLDGEGETRSFYASELVYKDTQKADPKILAAVGRACGELLREKRNVR